MARTWVVVLGVALGVSLAIPASPASAHNSLTGSNPENGARVAAAPQRIELRFLAKPDPGTTKITLTGPDNVAALGGEPTFSGSRVSVPFAPGAAGLYVVGYQVASGDGHPIKGEVRFTLTTGTPAQPPSSSPAASATPTAVPSSPAAAASPPAAAPAAAERSDDDDGGAGWLWALGGLVVLAALAAGLLLRRRSPRP
ncbi:copper resistance CopC family protein [Micromonospora rubida]|uniref:copper resistance CopC family protein n=1 Tax=Micromonospora rubida TaxID=2697657 RepID=UPI002E28CDA9|nr:copper resistance CopC family protein [Micromonospora rubida]